MGMASGCVPGEASPKQGPIPSGGGIPRHDSSSLLGGIRLSSRAGTLRAPRLDPRPRAHPALRRRHRRGIFWPDASRATCSTSTTPGARSLHPAGLVRALDRERFRTVLRAHAPRIPPPLRLGARRRGGAHRGLPAFRPFQPRGQHETHRPRECRGSGLRACQRAIAAPYGILLYEDFNLFHVCIGGGLDPFSPLGEDGKARFDATARRWFHGAAVVTDDHFELTGRWSTAPSIST